MNPLKKMILGANLPITMRHEKWLSENSNATYSPKAVEFGRKVLSGEAGGWKRTTTFRASGTGYCKRQRVFNAAGVPQHKIVDSNLANIFHTGNMLHLKWQLAGLTEGWLSEAEVSTENKTLNFGGTLDGILHNGDGFEFKSINTRGFTMVQQNGKPRADHIQQIHGYMILKPEITSFSVVYEDKNNGEWREFAVEKDQALISALQGSLVELNGHLAEKTLPDILPDCSRKEGSTYRNCPFRDMCLVTKKFPEGL